MSEIRKRSQGPEEGKTTNNTATASSDSQKKELKSGFYLSYRFVYSLSIIIAIYNILLSILNLNWISFLISE